jgi:uncharacterized membrane protein YphA (DoxX/SURF4 family)
MAHRRRRSASPPPAVAAAPSPEFEPRLRWLMYALRGWIVAMLVATLWLTWPLWGERAEPPKLPLIEWPPFGQWGTLMIATAATCIAWPRAGLAAHVLVSLAAMTDDQTRMQPQLLSFWFLLLGTLPQAPAQLVGRAHLASLWFFSGLHKLLSRGYYDDVAPFMWQGVFPAADWPHVPNYSFAFGLLTALAETAIGIAVLFPRLRRPAAVAAALLHLGIVCILYRLQWNTSVWPWNLGLAVVAPALLLTWKRSVAEERHACGLPAFVVAAGLFLSPLLYYAGLLDAYLSYCLYSANVPTAVFDPAMPGAPTYTINDYPVGPYWKNLNVPQPPTHRNFELYFRRTAKPGDAMLVEDPRASAVWFGNDRYVWRYAPTGIERVLAPPAAPR